MGFFKKEKQKKSRFGLGLLLGGIAAGFTALLYAPMSGYKLRQELSKKYKNAKKCAHQAEHDICEAADEFSGHTQKIAKKLAKKIKRNTKDL